MMLMPWWFVLIVWPLITAILSFTVGYVVASGRPWWTDARVRKWTRRKGS